MVTEGNREISFVIEKYLGVLSEAQNGWKKELNLVSWNGKPAKLDIREWSPDHQHMAKGITLRHEEAWLLQRALYRWLTGYGKQMASAQPGSSISSGAADNRTEPAADMSAVMTEELTQNTAEGMVLDGAELPHQEDVFMMLPQEADAAYTADTDASEEAPRENAGKTGCTEDFDVF